MTRLENMRQVPHPFEPGNGYDAKAEEWRAKLPEENETENP